LPPCGGVLSPARARNIWIKLSLYQWARNIWIKLSLPCDGGKYMKILLR